jgi:putative oxidoreductase
MSHVTTSPEAAAAAQTLFRVGLGGVLIAHGSQKLFGWFGGGGVEGTSKGMHAMGFRPAKPSAVLAGVGEAGAGLALALGLATPAAGAAAATTMGVAASVHAPNGFFATRGRPRVPRGAGPGGSGLHHWRFRTLLPGCAHRPCPGPALDADRRFSRDPHSHRDPDLPSA